MIISILNEKYKSGCGRGIDKYDEPSILDKLNAIIEWDYCEFPKTSWKTPLVCGLNEDGKSFAYFPQEEDREFLGKVPKLVPGTTFMVDGQVIAVDNPDRLVLILSKTGRNSLDRVVEEHINPEYKIKTGFVDNNTNISWEEIDEDPNDLVSVKIPYPIYNQWRVKFAEKRLKDPIKVRVIVNNQDLLFPETLIMREWDILCENYLKDCAELLTEEVISWFLRNYKRQDASPYTPKTEEELKEEFYKKNPDKKH